MGREWIGEVLGQDRWEHKVSFSQILARKYQSWSMERILLHGNILVATGFIGLHSFRLLGDTLRCRLRLMPTLQKGQRLRKGVEEISEENSDAVLQNLQTVLGKLRRTVSGTRMLSGCPGPGGREAAQLKSVGD